MIELLDFYSDNCESCKSMKPIIEELEKDFTITKINVEKTPEIASQYRIMSIPVFIFLKDGEEIQRLLGSQTKETMLDILNS